MSSSYLKALRKKAEQLSSGEADSSLALDIQELVHELEVHQIELELQHAELQSTLDELRSSKQKYVDLFDHAPVGYAIIGDKGIVLSLNLTLAQLLGIPRTKIEGNKFSSVIMQEDKDTFFLARRSVFVTQKPQTCEIRFLTSDQSVITVQLDLSLMSDTETCRITCTDITERKKAEQATVVALEHERELHELKTRLLNMITHEFRTPLTAMLNSIETLTHYRDKLTPKQEDERLQRIKNFIWYLSNMVSEVSHAYRTESNQIRIQAVSFNCETLIAELVDELNMLYDDRLHFVHSKTENKAAIVYTDPDLLKQIMLNLISNAIKYSDDDCTVTLEMKSDRFQIQVIDQGYGIPPEDQPYIFDTFFRGKNIETISGTGIGLNIVKRLVEANHGTIEFYSELNQGTTFTLTFPSSTPNM